MKFERLKQLVGMHLNLRFPEHPDSDYLAEWILDLSELDGYYLGIATSVLKKQQLKEYNRNEIGDMEKRLKSITIYRDKDRLIVDECENYIKSLRDIVEELNKLSNDTEISP